MVAEKEAERGEESWTTGLACRRDPALGEATGSPGATACRTAALESPKWPHAGGVEAWEITYSACPWRLGAVANDRAAPQQGPCSHL